MENSVGVQTCLARLEFSQDTCGVPRFLWNNTVVLLIIRSLVTTSTLIEWISITLFFRTERVKWLQYRFSCCKQLTKVHLAQLALHNACLFIYLGSEN